MSLAVKISPHDGFVSQIDSIWLEIKKGIENDPSIFSGLIDTKLLPLLKGKLGEVKKSDDCVLYRGLEIAIFKLNEAKKIYMYEKKDLESIGENVAPEAKKKKYLIDQLETLLNRALSPLIKLCEERK